MPVKRVKGLLKTLIVRAERELLTSFEEYKGFSTNCHSEFISESI